MTETRSLPVKILGNIESRAALASSIQSNTLQLQIETLPEIITVKWNLLQQHDEIWRQIRLFIGQLNIGLINTTIDENQPVMAEVLYKIVNEDFRDKNLAQLLFSLCAEDLYSQGVRKVTSKVVEGNLGAFYSRFNARKVLTGETFSSKVISTTKDNDSEKYIHLIETTL